MNDTLMGLPVEFWAILCFLVGGAYITFWPRPPRSATAPRTGLEHFVLRWFHAATWFCLGLATLALKFFGVNAAVTLGLIGLAGYITFMVFLIREKRRYPQG